VLRLGAAIRLARRLGLAMPGYRALLDYVDILRRPVARRGGSYDGAAARSPGRLEDADAACPPARLVRHARARLGAKAAPRSTACCCRGVHADCDQTIVERLHQE